MIQISFDNSPTAIAEHLLLVLVVVAVGAPSTIPAPFCVAGECSLLVQRCQHATHQHTHHGGPLLMCSPLRRFPLLPQVGKKSWRGVPHGAGWRPWSTCGGRGCLGYPSTLGKSNGALSRASSRALWKQGKTAQRRARQQRSTMMAVLVCGMLAALN